MAPWRDAMTMPVLAVAASMVLALGIIAAVYVYRHRARARDLVKRLAHDIESKPAKTYEVYGSARWEQTLRFSLAFLA